ncbi:MAG: CvpA family protein [Terracidiphilus sp.]|jgi:membrane protein required for colicin V production
MQWVDWAILLVLALSVVGGLAQGFFRSVCTLGGLVLGLALAAWNYLRLAGWILPIVRIKPVANVIAFVLIALLVMGIAALVGRLLFKVFHHVGLGCLDRLAGAAFGLFQGVLLVTLIILVSVAFFPEAQWLAEARMPRLFFGACHLSTHVTPAELSERVKHGLRELEKESPRWMHPNARG